MKKLVLYDYFDRMTDELLSSYNKTKLQKSSENMGENLFFIDK